MAKTTMTAVGRSWATDWPTIARGEGIYLYDTDGKRYIDGSGGSSAVTSIGHGVAEVWEAMAAQASAFSLSPSHAFFNQPALDLADLIAGLAPGEMRDNCKVWFAVTGTDSTDDAIRLARQHWVEKGQPAKYITISRWQAYHGSNIGSAGYSGHTMRRSIYTPMFVNSPHIPPAFCYRCPFEKTLPACELLCARTLETTIRQVGPENIAAFIAEPVVGAALGAVPAPDGYYQIIRDICDRYEILFIVDEVMTGWGRTGQMWGIEHWGVTPDIIATSKGITAGYAPLSAVIAKNEVWGPLMANNSPFKSGHTMNANPVSCTAAIATLNYILEHNLVENARTVGRYFLTQLQELLEYPMVGDVRGMGMMAGVEFVQDQVAKTPFPGAAQVSRRVAAAAMERGLVVYPLTGTVDGVAGDMIKLTPPLIATEAQIDEIMAILHASLAAVQTDLATSTTSH
jgi:adenosylmethionine-8-amino-7-oxononanoate aminotransferase